MNQGVFKVETSSRWLITGVAGFIGSNLLETLLIKGQKVIGIDNFLTGRLCNLEQVKMAVGEDAWRHFTFFKADICDVSSCEQACKGVDVILHQAALGSVPRSLADPLSSHANNVNGTLNLLVAAKRAGVKRFVYASSSSVYGDHPGLPKFEDRIGECLSPYAVTKRIAELYTAVFARNYGIETIGLRYFNVFGARQDPDGAYAAVIPKWISAMLKGEPVVINGDGETSRDFCYVANVVQANLLAATTSNPEALNQVFNIAVGGRATLNELHQLIRDQLRVLRPGLEIAAPVYHGFRPGDIRHSNADIGKARKLLGYQPTHNLSEGINEAIAWYEDSLREHAVSDD
jgi:UDP-N-acetylglucosamine/UDP-N-acetylgalactosamine 4-epimerase